LLIDYRYFGLQAQSYCLCGNADYDKHGAAETECVMPCAGHVDEICGGVFRNSVYELEYIVPKLIGKYM